MRRRSAGWRSSPTRNAKYWQLSEPVWPNNDIAQRLYLSEATVKSHLSRIFAKLQLTNRVQAAILAHQAGLVG